MRATLNAMGRREQWIIGVLFVVLLFLPGVLFVAGVRPTSVERLENRPVSVPPQLSPGGIVDEELYTALEAAYTDRLPGRDLAIRMDRAVRGRTTLGDPIQPGIPRGSEGWLFLDLNLVDDCPDDRRPAAFARSFNDLRHRLHDAGIALIFVVVPDKPSVYPQFLPVEGVAGWLDLAEPEISDCIDQWNRALDEQAEQRPWLLTLLEPMLAASGDPADPTYWQRDTHWTNRGALVQTEELIGHLAPELWDPTEVSSAPDRSRIGDLGVMKGFTHRQTTPGYRVDREGITVEREERGRRGPANLQRWSWAEGDGPVVEGTTVLIGDSFAVQSRALLEPYFEELVFLQWQFLRNNDLSDVLDTAPDRIVVAMAQRNLTRSSDQVVADGIERYLDDPSPDSQRRSSRGDDERTDDDDEGTDDDGDR